MSAPPMMITPGMFAVKRDDKPVFIFHGSDGTFECISADAVEGWAKLYSMQSDAIRQSAIGASMWGWDTPAAKPALE